MLALKYIYIKKKHQSVTLFRLGKIFPRVKPNRQLRLKVGKCKLSSFFYSRDLEQQHRHLFTWLLPLHLTTQDLVMKFTFKHELSLLSMKKVRGCWRKDGGSVIRRGGRRVSIPHNHFLPQHPVSLLSLSTTFLTPKPTLSFPSQYLLAKTPFPQH